MSPPGELCGWSCREGWARGSAQLFSAGVLPPALPCRLPANFSCQYGRLPGPRSQASLSLSLFAFFCLFFGLFLPFFFAFLPFILPFCLFFLPFCLCLSEVLVWPVASWPCARQERDLAQHPSVRVCLKNSISLLCCCYLLL